MNSWPSVSLSEIAQVFNGKTPAKAEQRSAGHPVLKIRNVDEFGRFRGVFESFVDESLAASYKKKQVMEGDTLILNAAHNAEYVGSKIYRAEPQTYRSMPTGEWLIVRPSAKLLASFLFFWITNLATRRQIRELVNGIHLYPKDVARLKIPLPPIEEQRRIVAILDQADALRAMRREALAELDKLEDSLFAELQLKTRDSCEQVPLASLAANARGSFVNGPFGSDLLTGELQNEGIPVVYIRDIRDGKYLRVSKAFVSEKKADELNVCKVFPGDVLVAKVGDPPGISAVYPPNEPTAIVTQDVIRIRPNLDIVLPEFISAYINSSIGKWKISGITVEATRARFSLRDFKSLVVDLPPLSRQTTFVAQIKSLRQLSGSQGESMNDLDSLFASLQHRAFGGEL